MGYASGGGLEDEEPLEVICRPHVGIQRHLSEKFRYHRLRHVSHLPESRHGVLLLIRQSARRRNDVNFTDRLSGNRVFRELIFFDYGKGKYDRHLK